MLRRLKKDVLTQLPPKRRQRIEVTPDSQMFKQIKNMLGDYLEELE
jgi:SNF2 family DNA or RNA helicase